MNDFVVRIRKEFEDYLYDINRRNYVEMVRPKGPARHDVDSELSMMKVLLVVRLHEVVELGRLGRRVIIADNPQ